MRKLFGFRGRARRRLVLDLGVNRGRRANLVIQISLIGPIGPIRETLYRRSREVTMTNAETDVESKTWTGIGAFVPKGLKD